MPTKKKDSSFTTIEILRCDKQKLMDLAMKISIAENGDYSKPPYPATMVGYAVDALEHRVAPTKSSTETDKLLMVSNKGQKNLFKKINNSSFGKVIH